MTMVSERIEPASKGWAYEDLYADYRAGKMTWREVSESFYWQALEVMPPVYAEGGFLVGEAWSHNGAGEALRAAFAEVGGRFFATISTSANYPTRREGLADALRAQQRAHEHIEKYDALIEKMGGLAKVAGLVPADMNTIRAALREDEHLNNIPLTRWDAAAEYQGGLDGNGPVRLGNRYGWPSGLSLADRVCMLKRAATRVANGETTR